MFIRGKEKHFKTLNLGGESRDFKLPCIFSQISNTQKSISIHLTFPLGSKSILYTVALNKALAALTELEDPCFDLGFGFSTNCSNSNNLLMS